MVDKTILEPLLPVIESNPEVAIPVIVGYRGYETVRDIKTLSDSVNAPSTSTGRRFPQPFYRGSSIGPPTPSHYVSASSGGVIIPSGSDSDSSSRSATPEQPVRSNDLVPRYSDGTIDLDALQTQRQNNQRRIGFLNDDISFIRDRREVNRIRNRFRSSDNNIPYLPQEREPLIPVPGDQIEIPPSGPDNELDLFRGNDQDYSNQNIITSDAQLTDEDVGLAQPYQRLVSDNPQTDRSLDWFRIPSVLQNPKMELPKTSNPVLPPDIPRPSPYVPPPTVQEPTQQPVEPTSEPMDTVHDLYIQPVPYVISAQEQLNLFPIFASGMALSALILGVPLLL